VIGNVSDRRPSVLEESVGTLVRRGAPYCLIMPSTEEYIAAGLYDPDSDGEIGRLDLLDWLAAKGFTIDDMVEALNAGGLNALATDWRTLPGELLTLDDAIAISGMDPGDLEAFTRALGFTRVLRSPVGEIGLTRGEIEASALFSELNEMFSRDEAVGLLRVIGSSIGRIGEASVLMFLNDIESKMLASGESELDMAITGYESVGLLELLSRQIEPILLRHVQQAVERTRAATIEHNERFLYRYAIGFVDLVGFTGISGSMQPQDLSAFMREFEGRAHDVVTDVGARIVKLIGDEVMFAATDASAACRAASALMDGFGSEFGHVVPRAGIAYGDVLVRGGDYYGSVVNLASRLVDEAVPQELLVTEDVRNAAEDCQFESAGRRMVKGFDDPVTVYALVST
jgi:class 3 adenylate cyclase